MPKISVLMSVYNGERYLREAVDSILNQTFTDFEFIIVDDGSADGTSQILDSYADPRIVHIRNEKNLGLATSLNIGIDRAQGEYIARMDADDISLPHRFGTQTKFMETNPDIDFLGTNIRYMDAMGILSEKILYNDAPAPSGAYLKWLLLWGNPLAHPTMMMRRSTLDHHQLRYDPRFNAAEDYDLWARAARVCNLATIPDVCLTYRKHEASVTSTRQSKQVALSQSLIKRELCNLLSREISQEAIDALGSGMAWEHGKGVADYVSGAYIVRDAMGIFRHRYLPPAGDIERIRTHAIGLVRRVVRRAGTQSRGLALRSLWVLRGVSGRAFFSVQTLKDAVKVGLLKRQQISEYIYH